MQIRPAVSRRFHPFWSKWMYFITLGFHRLIMTHPFVCWLHLWFTMHLCVNEAIFTMPLNIGNTDTAQGRGGRLWRRYTRESRWNSAIFFKHKHRRQKRGKKTDSCTLSADHQLRCVHCEYCGLIYSDDACAGCSILASVRVLAHVKVTYNLPMKKTREHSDLDNLNASDFFSFWLVNIFLIINDIDAAL